MIKKKPKREFSKMLVAWAMIVTTLCVVTSYTLAFFDHDPCIEVTVSVSAACIAIAVAYEAKTAAEKHSRNKFGLDKNGKPINKNDEEIGG